LSGNRIWEIDLLRALAIVLMVIFHLVYDLAEFVGLNINYMSGFWFWEGKISALLFIFLAGISSGLCRNTVKRGLKVFLFGMVITIATYIFDKEQYVRFGILHFLGVSMMLFPILNRVKNWGLAILAIISGLIAIPIDNTTLGTSLFLPFGFMYKGFVSMDYYPIFPYIGVFILGVIAYKAYYYKRKSLFQFSFENMAISIMSKNSLLIYLTIPMLLNQKLQQEL
jgi:uncharacterized membrane protein